MAAVKRFLGFRSKPKERRGRPIGSTKAKRNAINFGWAKKTPQTIARQVVRSLISRPTTQITPKTPLTPLPKAPPRAVPIPIGPQTQAVTQQLKVIAERKRFILGKQKEAQVYLNEGALMPSSVVDELEYDEDRLKVHVELDGRQYTYHGVPPSVFDRWWQGKASCITEDKGKFRRRRWIIGKTPSLGAFYNRYIKGRYTQTSGYV